MINHTSLIDGSARATALKLVPSRRLAAVSDGNDPSLDLVRAGDLVRGNRFPQQYGLVGSSPIMKEVFELIRNVAPLDYPVVVTGESGTGKELVARAVHAESSRSRGPFVPVNCGALPENVLESELFGHVRGAFTDAFRTKRGRFELADGGTLFLDEIGELSSASQVKLLRVLQEKEFERVGGEETISVDVRVVSATNRDLRKMVQEGSFREDLFFRLCVVPIHLPPLRKRRSDLNALIEHLLTQVEREVGRRPLCLSSAVLQHLLDHDWPGNVRELLNALRCVAVRCGEGEIDVEHLPESLLGPPRGASRPSRTGSDKMLRVSPEKRPKLDAENVSWALAETGGNKTDAAKLLNVSRATLYRHLATQKQRNP